MTSAFWKNKSSFRGARGQHESRQRKRTICLSGSRRVTFCSKKAGRPNLSIWPQIRTALSVSLLSTLALVYSKALEILSRNYPSVAPDQSEPGTTLPQNNPLVLYLSGYYREKLGEPGANDYARASHLSTLYVFQALPKKSLRLKRRCARIPRIPQRSFCSARGISHAPKLPKLARMESGATVGRAHSGTGSRSRLGAAP